MESLRARRTSEGGGVEFRVRWVGCHFEQDTWEAESSIGAEHIARFEQMEAAMEAARIRAVQPDSHRAAKKRGASFVRV